MAFTTKDSFTFNHADQTIYPGWTPEQTALNLDARGEELRLALNVVINLLNSSAAAASIGVVPPSGIAGSTVKTVLDALKDAIDDVVAGATADGSLEDVKLSNTATEIKARFAAHLLDSVMHVTADERTTWNAKLTATSYTATDVLAKILTVDGVGTGLDADLLDGYQSGNSAGQIPISNGVENATLNAALLNGSSATQIVPTLGTALQYLRVNSAGTAKEWGDLPIKLLADVTLSSGAANIDLTSIDTSYPKLILIPKLISGSAIDLRITFNNDTGSNYNQVHTSVSGTTVSGATISSAAYINLAQVINSGGASPSPEIHIQNIVAGGTKHFNYNYLTGGSALYVGSGYWNNTAELISRITLTPASSTFSTGSKVILWGMK